MRKTKLKGLFTRILIIGGLLIFFCKFSSSSNETKLSCGIQCLTYVFEKFGIKVRDSELKRFKGENMYQLYKEAKRKGLNAVGVKVNLEDIMRLKTIAISHLWNNHFVVVEPEVQGNKIKIYDPLIKKVKEIEIKKFKRYYSGFSLLISNRNIKISRIKKEKAPDIRFDNYNYGFGTVEEGTKIPFKFIFVNKGEKLLKILKVRSTCGCVLMNIKKNKILPGEKGIIEGIFNTEGRMGFQKQPIYVHTNDPITPIVVLTISGFVNRRVYVVPEIIRFGEVEKGKVEEREIYVVNPRKNRKLKVEKIESNLSGLQWKIIESRNKNRPGYKIKFSFQPEILQEEINGKVSIFTNDKKYSRFDIPVVGKIKSDVEIYPELCFFYGEKNREEIKINFRKPVNKIGKIETSSPFLKVTLLPENKKEYRLKVYLDGYHRKYIKEKIEITYTTTNNNQKIVEIPVYGIVERR